MSQEREFDKTDALNTAAAASIGGIAGAGSVSQLNTKDHMRAAVLKKMGLPTRDEFYNAPVYDENEIIMKEQKVSKLKSFFKKNPEALAELKSTFVADLKKGPPKVYTDNERILIGAALGAGALGGIAGISNYYADTDQYREAGEDMEGESKMGDMVEYEHPVLRLKVKQPRKDYENWLVNKNGNSLFSNLEDASGEGIRTGFFGRKRITDFKSPEAAKEFKEYAEALNDDDVGFEYNDPAYKDVKQDFNRTIDAFKWASEDGSDITKESGDYIAELIKEAMATAQRKELTEQDFAYPEARKFPIHDAKHVSLAWGYVDKSNLSPEEKNKVRKNIKARAQALNMDTSHWKVAEEAFIEEIIKQACSE